MTEKREFIELPDMDDGNCDCESITQDKIAGFPAVTIGMYCVCEYEPKRGKKRKLKVETMGMREVKDVW